MEFGMGKTENRGEAVGPQIQKKSWLGRRHVSGYFTDEICRGGANLPVSRGGPDGPWDHRVFVAARQSAQTLLDRNPSLERTTGLRPKEQPTLASEIALALYRDSEPRSISAV